MPATISAVRGMPIPRPAPRPAAIELPPSLSSFELLTIVAPGDVALAAAIAPSNVTVTSDDSVALLERDVEVDDVVEEEEVAVVRSSSIASSVKYAGESGVQEQLSFVPRQQNAPVPQARTPTAPTAVHQRWLFQMPWDELTVSTEVCTAA
jgi:hypothetical protein